MFNLDEQVKAYNETVGDLTDGVDCDKCKNKGYYETLDGIYIESHKCKCLRERKINRTIADSGLADVFDVYTFDLFDTETPYHLHMKQKAQSFIAEGGYRWFMVAGQIGSGKSHICTAISKTMIERGMSFKYLSYAQDMPRITKRMDSGYIDIKEKAEHEFDNLKNVNVLYIDDYLKGEKTDKLFELINHRYNNKTCITIFSTEKSMQEQKHIDEAIVSRIYQRCGGYWVEVAKGDGKNYRFGG